MALPKTYRAVARLGWTSDTGRPRRRARADRRACPRSSATCPTGELMQRPPAYSAVKVGGERLYEKARRGEAVEGEPRPVTVHRFELLWREGERARFEIECSSGTYVRQLVADPRRRLLRGARAHGDRPLPARGRRPRARRAARRGAGFLPERTLDAEEAAARGARARASTGDSGRRGAVRLTHGGALVAIAEPRGRRPASRRRVQHRLRPGEGHPAPGRRAKPRRKVAIGTFDGVHLGHREVIRGSDTVLTFDPHPLAVIQPRARCRSCSTPPAIKRDLIAGLGVEELVVIPFDREFADEDAEEFVEEVLVEQLGADPGVGGRELPLRQEGDGRRRHACAPVPSSRRAWCRSWRWRARPCPRATSAASWRPATWTRRRASSAAPFLFEGEVVHGDKRGRELGMPTANIVPDDRLAIPGHGVYAAWAHGHPAAVNVGVRPTFDTGRGAAGRGLPARLRRRPLRRDPADRLCASGCAARSASSRSTSWSLQMKSATWTQAADDCLCYRSPPMTLTDAKKHEIVTQVRQVRSRTPARPRSRSPCSPARINHLTEHLREHKKDHHSPPWAADAGRPAPPAAELPAAQGPRSLPRADRGARPPALATMIEPGAPAPDFTLPDQDGNDVTLADLRGQTTSCSSSTRSTSARPAPTS